MKEKVTLPLDLPVCAFRYNEFILFFFANASKVFKKVSYVFLLMLLII
jgi:hypothetical protein